MSAALACPDCQSPYRASDVSVATGVALCRVCDRAMPLARGADRAIAAPAPRPHFVTESELGGGLELSWPWPRGAGAALLAFAVFWDLFLVFWYATALQSDDAPVMMLVFPLLHVGAGVFITWSALANLLNHTRLRLRSGRLTIEAGPVPWFGFHKELLTSGIQQLFVVEGTERQGKHGRITVYHLECLRRDGIGIRLVGGLRDLGHARYVEQRLESALSIDDRPVEGEVRG